MLRTGPAYDALNSSVAGTTTPTGMPAPYTQFRIDSFDRLQFDGCTVTIGGNFTFIGTVTPDGDEHGYFQVIGTVDVVGFLFGGRFLIPNEQITQWKSLTFLFDVKLDNCLIGSFY